MADLKISQLPAAAAINGTEQVPVNQVGTTVRTTVALIKNYVLTFVNGFTGSGGGTLGNWRALNPNAAGAIEIKGGADGDALVTGGDSVADTGGDVHITSGAGGIDGGEIRLSAGNSSISGSGGAINIVGGAGKGGAGNGGSEIAITAGPGTDVGDNGGSVQIFGGAGNTFAGEVHLFGGSGGASVQGGNVILEPGNGTSRGNTIIKNLPALDPGVSGALYVVAGVLKVSP